MNASTAFYRIVLILMIVLFLLGLLVYGYIQLLADLARCRQSASSQAEELGQVKESCAQYPEEIAELRGLVASLQGLLSAAGQDYQASQDDNRALRARLNACERTNPLYELLSDWRSWVVEGLPAIGFLAAGAGAATAVRHSYKKRGSVRVTRLSRRSYTGAGKQRERVDLVQVSMTREQADEYVRWQRGRRAGKYGRGAARETCA